jgi:putative glycosyltransferase (TIGR04372 family)
LNSKKVANKDVLSMFIEYSKTTPKVNIFRSSFFYFFISFSLKIFEKNQLIVQLDYNSNESEFSLGEKIVSFTESQKTYGEKVLRLMHISKKEKIVSIFARDSSFLKSYDSNLDWSYHDYRDSNIKSYIKSIKYLISKGYTVVRIGSEHSSSLSFDSDSYIEYNLSEYKSSFMDLYIPYISEFIIGSRSGATDVSLLFNTPLLVVNSTTFNESPLGMNDLFIQKKLIDSEGKIIPYKELIKDRKYYSPNGNELEKLFGIKYIDNTDNEILEVTIEMHNRLTKNFVLNSNQLNLLERYQSEYCMKNLWSNRLAPISINWLEKNHHLYLNNDVNLSIGNINE